jgi:hypothetical protein
VPGSFTLSRPSWRRLTLGPDHPQHLEKRIHALIIKAIATSGDAEELEKVITELRGALKEHIRRLREIAASNFSARAGE